MSMLRSKIGWALAGTLGLLVVGALAAVTSGGSLDPPGPPAPTGPIQVQVVATTPVLMEFTTVVVDCYNPASPANVRAALLGSIAELNALGAGGWGLVGAPSVNITASGCVTVYMLQKPAGGAGTPTPTLTPWPGTATLTPTATNTPLPSSTPTVTATPTAF
jgi:hypothetical protein